jgi:hypothetical protein
LIWYFVVVVIVVVEVSGVGGPPTIGETPRPQKNLL